MVAKKQQQNTYQYGKRAQIVVCAIRFPSQCSLNMWLYVDEDFIFIYIYIHNISHGFCCYTFYILFLACLRFILPIWLCSKNVQMLTYTESSIDMMADLLLYLLKHICIAHTIAGIFVNHYYSLFDLHHIIHLVNVKFCDNSNSNSSWEKKPNRIPFAKQYIWQRVYYFTYKSL